MPTPTFWTLGSLWLCLSSCSSNIYPTIFRIGRVCCCASFSALLLLSSTFGAWYFTPEFIFLLNTNYLFIRIGSLEFRCCFCSLFSPLSSLASLSISKTTRSPLSTFPAYFIFRLSVRSIGACLFRRPFGVTIEWILYALFNTCLLHSYFFFLSHTFAYLLGLHFLTFRMY
jgi:hypothetical protein